MFNNNNCNNNYLSCKNVFQTFPHFFLYMICNCHYVLYGFLSIFIVAQHPVRTYCNLIMWLLSFQVAASTIFGRSLLSSNWVKFICKALLRETCTSNSNLQSNKGYNHKNIHFAGKWKRADGLLHSLATVTDELKRMLLLLHVSFFHNYASICVSTV